MAGRLKETGDEGDKKVAIWQIMTGRVSICSSLWESRPQPRRAIYQALWKGSRYERS